MAPTPSFQDQIPHNHCFGCSPQNAQGLQIKSYWSGPHEAACRFRPQPHHCSGPLRYVNGGIVASVIDCHCVCTAMADAYERAGRPLGTGALLSFVTGRLEVNYKNPVPIADEMIAKATIFETGPRKTILHCNVWSGDILCADARVIAVNIGDAWSSKRQAS